MGDLTREVQRSAGVSHAIAACVDCGWSATTYKNAVALAAKHARHHGHLVKAEQMISIEYNGRSLRTAIAKVGRLPR